MQALQFALTIPLSALPAVLLILTVRRLKLYRPTSRVAFYFTAALGVLACVPAAAIEWFEGVWLGDASLMGGRFLDAFLVAGFTEESLKLLAVLGYAYRLGLVGGVMDGVAYTAAAGLGFGLAENLLFSANDPATGMLRALTAVPVHAVSAAVMGYFVGRARFVAESSKLGVALSGLFFALLIHGTYDWAVFNHDGYWFAESSAVLLGAGAGLAALVRHAMRLDESMLGRASLGGAESTWPTNVTTTLVPNTVEPGVVPSAVESAAGSGANGAG